jgi:hypothetical protein
MIDNIIHGYGYFSAICTIFVLAVGLYVFFKDIFEKDDY